MTTIQSTVYVMRFLQSSELGPPHLFNRRRVGGGLGGLHSDEGIDTLGVLCATISALCQI
jgi:hypothetical protein